MITYKRNHSTNDRNRGSKKWTREMDFSVKKDCYPWESESVEKKGKVVAGYAIEYGELLTYVTIECAGHMVPTFKPAFAQTMFSKFINNSPF